MTTGPLTTRKGCLRPSFVDFLRSLYGRLFDDRFLSRVGACCLFGLMALFCSPAFASVCPSYDQAKASCDAYAAPGTATCVFVNSTNWLGGKPGFTAVRKSDGATVGAWGFNCPAGACAASPNVVRRMPITDYGSITGGGPHMCDSSCDYVFTGGSALGGNFAGNSAPTGKYCWEVGGATPPPMAPPAAAPCIVSDLLCFLPGDGRVCANVGNKKVCSEPRADKPPPNAGKCISGTDAAAGAYICTGSPDAPRPLDSKGNLVPDSSKTSDLQMTVVPGPPSVNYNVNITTHDTTSAGSDTGGVPKSDPGNGKSDKDGNCPDGSTPSAGGCGAGYADNGCEQPPACSGDALLCAQLRETHQAACDSRKFMADSGMNFKPSDLDDIVGLFSPIRLEADTAWNGKIPEGCTKGADGGMVCAPGSASTDPVEADAPKLEEKRFWGGRASCPGIHEITLHGQTTDMSVQACKTTGYLGDIVLAAAYVIAALAFARSMSGS